MTDTKNDSQKPGSIDERLATMESESMKQQPKEVPAQEVKKVETPATPTVVQESTTQIEALKENKPVLAFVAGLIIGALIVWLI